jgi:hypothetical protein
MQHKNEEAHFLVHIRRCNRLTFAVYTKQNGAFQPGWPDPVRMNCLQNQWFPFGLSLAVSEPVVRP